MENNNKSNQLNVLDSVGEVVGINLSNLRSTIHKGNKYYSCVDLMGEAYTDSKRARKHWNDFKRDNIETSDWIGQLKLQSRDGKRYYTDCATEENIYHILMLLRNDVGKEFRVYSSRVVKQRREETENPELGISRANQRAELRYKSKGKSDRWVTFRINKTIPTRNEFASELDSRGIVGKQFGLVTDRMNKNVFGMYARDIQKHTGNPVTRDGMGISALSIVNACETTSIGYMRKNDSQGYGSVVNGLDKVSKAYGTLVKTLEGIFEGDILTVDNDVPGITNKED